MRDGGEGWTPEMDAVLHAHYRSLTPRTLAKQLNKSSKAVIGRAWRLGINRSEPQPPVPKPPAKTPVAPGAHASTRWTPEMDEILRANWGRRSANTIAQALGVTKNAVIGRAGRLGLASLKAPTRGPESQHRKQAPDCTPRIEPRPCDTVKPTKRVPLRAEAVEVRRIPASVPKAEDGKHPPWIRAAAAEFMAWRAMQV